MSNEIPKEAVRRSYRQRVRARRRDDVHHRITLAAVELHGSVGPARTTVSDIAKLAGVRRATVYNHFPTDLELIDSCSSHWFGENPPPNPEEWASIEDPAHRMRTALEAMYEYYDRGQDMLGKVLRDAPHVPALQEILRQKWWPLLEVMTDILVQGWHYRESESKIQTNSTGENSAALDNGLVEIRVSIKVALDFFTWHMLSTSGLSNENAARLAAAWIAACSGGSR